MTSVVHDGMLSMLASINDENLGRRIATTIDDLVASYRDADIDRRVSLCDENVVFVDPVGLPEIRGRKAIADFFRQCLADGWSFAMAVEELVVCSNEALMTWNVNISRAGQGQVRLRSSNMMVFTSDGLIARWRAIFDPARLGSEAVPGRDKAVASRAVVEDYIARLIAGRADADDLIADHASWWVAGGWDGGGSFSKAEMGRVAEVSQLWFREPMRFSVRGLIAHDAYVAVELHSDALLRDGAPYNNDYVMIYEVRDGLIVSIREYLDTQHIAESLRALGETHPAVAMRANR